MFTFVSLTKTNAMQNNITNPAELTNDDIFDMLFDLVERYLPTLNETLAKIDIKPRVALFLKLTALIIFANNAMDEDPSDDDNTYYPGLHMEENGYKPISRQTD